MKKLLLFLPFLLMACTKPETPAQDIFLAESDYIAALQLELTYDALPRCTTPKVNPICSDPAIMKKVRIADDIAYSSLKAAETAVRTPNFDTNTATTAVASATALIKAFSGITANLGVK